MRRSGCSLILIGYESLDEANLRQMNKGWMGDLGSVAELTRRIHEAGMNIYATFLFGFDHDTRDLYDRTLAFARSAGFFCAAFNHLLPMPGTPLYDRLASEGRLRSPQWWLQPGYRYGELVFEPVGFAAAQVGELCRQYRKAFYTPGSIIRRSFAALRRGRSLAMVLYYWYINLRLAREVEEKNAIPIGENLDELPK
jgi:radical SAM superfamily enzyme YgiQ (UPF0313 family)